MDRNGILQIHVEDMQKGLDEMENGTKELVRCFPQQISQENPTFQSLLTQLYL